MRMLPGALAIVVWTLAAAHAGEVPPDSSRPAPPRTVAGAVFRDRIRPGFVETVLADSLDAPVGMALAPDGRVFVCEQGGAVRVVRDGRVRTRPFTIVPTAANVEEGLLSVAFDPAFARNGWVYLLYTAQAPHPHERIVRVTASGDTALAGSERTIFELDPHHAHLHVGGAMHFGRDGMLFVGTGDNDHGEFSQTLRSTFGKLLRIRPDGGIPEDNPFDSLVAGRYRAVWARGLRNVFSFDVNPRDGRIFMNDVGDATWEEVDEAVRGGNYGWPYYEGPGAHPGYRAPLYAYDHRSGCAITGGAFYAPARATFPPRWRGRYFFADFCAAEIRALDPRAPARAERFGPTLAAGPVDLRVTPGGDLLVLMRGDANPVGASGRPYGMLVRVSYPGPRGGTGSRARPAKLGN